MVFYGGGEDPASSTTKYAISDTDTIPSLEEFQPISYLINFNFDNILNSKYLFIRIDINKNSSSSVNVQNFSIEIKDYNMLVCKDSFFTTQLISGDYINIQDLNDSVITKQIYVVHNDYELTVTEAFVEPITEGSKFIKIDLDELKACPVGVHLPNNTLNIFYLVDGQIHYTRTDTTLGQWEDRSFAFPSIYSWDEEVELLSAKYLSGAFAWLTWHLEEDAKHMVALFPTPDRYRFEPQRKPNLYLAKPNRQIIGILESSYAINLQQKLGGINQLTFKMPYNIDINNEFQRELNVDNIKTHYLVALGYENVYHKDWFLVAPIQDDQTSNSDEKTITCFCLSHQLSGFLLRNFRVESATPQMLLTQILANTPWKSGMISDEIKNKYRTYETASKNILDFLLTDVTETLDCYVIFDSEELRVNLIHPDKVGDYIGLNFSYGQYLKTIGKKSDPQEFCTHLKPYGKDNMPVNEVNPTGQNYLFDYSYFLHPFKRDMNKTVISSSDYMSDDLCNAVLDYMELLESKNGVQTLSRSLTTLSTLHILDHGLVVGDYILNRTRNSEFKRVLSVIDNNMVTINPIPEQSPDDEIWLYKDGTFRKLLFRKWDIMDDRIKLNADLFNLETQKKILLDTIAVKQQQGLPTWDEQQQLVIINNQIAAVQAQLDSLDDVYQEIDDLKVELLMINNFTPTQLKELSYFIKEKEWNNNYIYDPLDLIEEAQKAFKEINKPKIDFSIDIVNFTECIEEEYNWDKLVLADRVRIQHDTLNINSKARILEITYDFEKQDVNIRLANPIRKIRTSEDKFIDMLSKSMETTNILASDRPEWNNIVDIFNSRTNRIAVRPANPSITAINHEVNTDSSVNLYVTWDFNGNDERYEIDGFVVYVRTLTSNVPYTFGSSVAREQLNLVTTDKRAYQLLGIPASNYYYIGVQAYRHVDADISTTGILSSSIIQNTTPYQPDSNYVGLLKNFSGSVLPVANESYRGQLFTKLGGQGVADEKYVCLKKIDDTYEWILL